MSVAGPTRVNSAFSSAVSIAAPPASGGAIVSRRRPAAAQRGANIERVQKALKDSGHDPGPIDGVNGPRTAAALKTYQKAQGLEVTGRLDDVTLAKLGGVKRTPSTTQAGGDTRPSPADPAQANKTGANVGEGAS